MEIKPSSPQLFSKSSKRRRATKITKKSVKISTQLKKLAKQLNVKDYRDLIEPEITGDDVDQLLRIIQYSPKETLMDIAQTMIDKNKNKNPYVIQNIKIQVLLDNLAKKICNCTGYLENAAENNSSTTNINAACRRRIFLNRNIDFITYDCGDAPKDKERFNYGEGPLLKPKLHSKTKYTLRRPIKKSAQLN